MKTRLMSTERRSWDQWGLDIAEAVAGRADCTRRQVGSVVMDKDHRVISVGYNGAPSGDPGCATDAACPRGQLSLRVLGHGGGDYDHCIAVHSEANAIMYSDPVRRVGGTLYCTDAPCSGCLKLIRGSGLARIVYLLPDGEVEEQIF